MGIRENVFEIKEIIKETKRDLSEVSIVAVTKKRTASEAEEVSFLVDSIAESRLQEAIGKIDFLSCKKHFVGHLQSNKARKAVEMFDVICSVDSLKLAKKIDFAALDAGKVQEVYFEVNIGEEDAKYGVSYDEALDFYSKLLKLVNIKVTGVMCIAPLDKDPRPYFRKMKELFDKLPIKVLSMGMSDDFKVAVEEGATEVRIGRKLFR